MLYYYSCNIIDTVYGTIRILEQYLSNSCMVQVYKLYSLNPVSIPFGWYHRYQVPLKSTLESDSDNQNYRENDHHKNPKPPSIQVHYYLNIFHTNKTHQLRNQSKVDEKLLSRSQSSNTCSLCRKDHHDNGNRILDLEFFRNYS